MKKSHLYTLTVNPALDVSGHVAKILLDEKNNVHELRADPGGNAINAARMLKRLGCDPILLGFLGGPTGRQIRQLLKKENLIARFTPIRDNTRTNITITNDVDNRQTRLTFPGPKIRAAEIQNLLGKIESIHSPAILIIGGSLPNCPLSLYDRLIKHVRREQIGIIVDVPAGDLKRILSHPWSKLLMIKPNRVEFQLLLNKRMTSTLQLARGARELLGKCEIICVSLGEEGALLVWNQEAWLIAPPPIRRRGTVGAGDSMVGAISARLAASGFTHPEKCLSSPPIIESVRWGVAAGAATAMTNGTRLGKRSLVHKLYPQTTVKQIL